MQFILTIGTVEQAVANFGNVHTRTVIAGELFRRAIAAVMLCEDKMCGVLQVYLIVQTVLHTVAHSPFVDTLAISATELTHTFWTVGCWKYLEKSDCYSLFIELPHPISSLISPQSS
jgi:hypothetical protein